MRYKMRLIHIYLYISHDQNYEGIKRIMMSLGIKNWIIS